MTTTPTSIRPRLRTRTPELESATGGSEPEMVPDRLLLPRVLIRVPHMVVGPQAAAPAGAKAGTAIDSAAAASGQLGTGRESRPTAVGEVGQTAVALLGNASVAVNSTPEELAAAAENDSIFNTLWAQATTFVPAKHLKIMGIGLLVLIGIWCLRGRGHHAAPDAPGADAPAWTGPAAPTWPNHPADTRSPGNSGPVAPWVAGPQTVASAPTPQIAGGNFGPVQKSAALIPTGPFANGGLPPCDAAMAGPAGGGQNQPRGDSIPSMPSRDPAWANTLQRNNAPLVQNGPPADGYRTAQRFDPTAVPAGRSDSVEPGVARLQGNITSPSGEIRQ